MAGVATRAVAAALLLLLVVVAAEPPPSERSALLAFLAATPHERRLGWNSSTSACGWVGVTCDAGNATVVQVRLPGVGLIGAIPPGTLGRLTNLQVLSLRSNRILGGIPDDVLQLPQLRLLFLQNNLLSGAIPPAVGKLAALERLVLSSNNLSGPIPFTLNNLTSLRALRLDGNKLSGNIPSISIQSLAVFNVSDNNLNGSIPAPLARFPAEDFAGNLQLCGSPLPPCKSFFPSPSPSPGMSPADVPGVASSSKKRRLSGAAIAGIVVGAVVLALLLLVAAVLCAVSKRRRGASEEPKSTTAAAAGAGAAAARGVPPPGSGEGTGMTSSSKEDMGGASGSAAAAVAAEPSRLVFVGKGAGYSFDLEDLLRASAEVLGKGSVGTSYKAVLEEGTTVVVKRLKDVAVARREFDAHMDALGKVEHRNVLPVRAYYFSKDEKLLVFDYLPNGSLSAMLHGSRGSGKTPLDWDARMRSALSAARGLAHLHTVHSLVHGNVKSSNVLLRPDADAAALSDFCLHPIFAPSSARPGAGGYRAPEVVDTRRPTYKADVYSLGVLLLELLTGKSPTHASLEGDGTLDLPRWVQSVVREEWTAEVFDVELVRLGASAEEEMVALLQVAMACVATVPDARPDAPDVVRMIEEIGGGHGRTTTEESEEGVRGTSEEERSRGTPPAAPTP
uniref:Protein kinase domain-containing protein n=1 Tax=Oryza meridionalis TaxID=40149 RepID=A0A0E0C4I4_9ORYZ